MRKVLYRLVQWTWGFPQTFIGFILYLIYKKYPHHEYKGSIVTNWPKKGGVSLGMYTFIDNRIEKHENIKKHEYGHTIQSLILGPTYLIIVGIPSFIWCNLPFFRKLRRKKKTPYNTFFVEKNADLLGGVKDKDQTI